MNVTIQRPDNAVFKGVRGRGFRYARDIYCRAYRNRNISIQLRDFLSLREQGDI